MKCCICGKEIEKKKDADGHVYWDTGHNAMPIADGRCCDQCNDTKVIPARLAGYRSQA